MGGEWLWDKNSDDIDMRDVKIDEFEREKKSSRPHVAGCQRPCASRPASLYKSWPFAWTASFIRDMSHIVIQFDERS